MYNPLSTTIGSGSGIVGLILAGGKSRRMGSQGPKCLTDLDGKTLLRRVIDRANSQCSALVINANESRDLMEGYGLPIISDTVDGFAGPLAGVLAGMEWARKNREDCTHLVSFPCDSPFFPRNLVDELKSTLNSSKKALACAACKGQSHPVFGIWSLKLEDQLREALTTRGVRKVDEWTGEIGIVEKAFRAPGGIDPFFNINTPEDLAVAERMVKKLK